MFEGLFEEENEGATGGVPFGPENYPGSSGSPTTRGLAVPPTPRLPCGLSGIANQGATCYLNSLLQTLLLTPEFREQLFCLGPDELGDIKQKDVPGAKVRVIPIELQRLFARLLLSNRQAAKTTELTDSFGWTNREELQQQDVQELNRVLFSAIEDSLLGTTGENLISQLYHGTLVNQIICQSCGRVSDRQEEFLDLTLTVTQGSSVETSLYNSYVEMEKLDGGNQYFCEKCNKLVDAKKGAKICKLPSILSLSLLRFSFDYQKMERFKETGKMAFPMELDMGMYCDQANIDDSLYELFSVVIHGGSTHGGHYHAYIRDVDCLGNWTSRDQEDILLPTDPSTGKVDFIEFDTPLELLQAIVSKEQYGMAVDKLCSELVKQTGVSWNKRFKKQYGPINKFLQKYDDKFIVNKSTNWVSLKDYRHSGESKMAGNKMADSVMRSSADRANATQDESRSNRKEKNGSNNGQQRTKSASGKGRTRSKSREETVGSNSEKECNNSESAMKEASSSNASTSAAKGVKSTVGLGNNPELGPSGDESTHSSSIQQPDHPPEGHCWFDFNDSRVQSIYTTEIEKQFSGKESAYMLFYRRKSMTRPKEAHGNPLYRIPGWLVTEVFEENEALDKERMEYDIAVNKINIKLYFADGCMYESGAIQTIVDCKELNLDRRKTVEELICAVIEVAEDPLPDPLVIHTAKHLPSGLHLYECISASPSVILCDVGVCDGAVMFIWNGKQVQGIPVPTGLTCEPIFLTVTYGNSSQLSQGFAKDLTLGEFKVFLSEQTQLDANAMAVGKIVVKESSTTLTSFSAGDDCHTLAELGLSDGDQLVVETPERGTESTPIAEQELLRCMNTIVVNVENRYQTCDKSQNKSAKVEVEKSATVGELKSVILSKFDLISLESSCRLRMDDPNLGLCSPLHEDLCVNAAGLKNNTNLVLEAGAPPEHSQITLTFIPLKSCDIPENIELIIDKTATVTQCMQRLRELNKFKGDNFHLCKTNWCQEKADILDDLDATLDQYQLNNGDLLLMEEGKVIPKGYLKLSVFLLSQSRNGSGVVSWITSGLQGLLSSSSADQQQSSENNLIDLGEIIISKEATLSDLKIHILTLDGISHVTVPMVEFLRVCVIENGRLTSVLRGEQQKLQRLKLSSESRICVQVLQQDEQLNQNQILLHIQVRIPNTRCYAPYQEILWDTSKGPTVQDLKQVIADAVCLPVDGIEIAKHFVEKYEWLVIKELTKGKNANQKKGKKQNKTNLRHGPFLLRDGDIIGVKDLRHDPLHSDDFSTEFDSHGREKLRQIAEEKKRRRKENKNQGTEFGPENAEKRRPEAGLSIKVQDFRGG